MQHGICTLSVVPARREPAGTSEMVTQLLFGEHYTVIGQKDDWLRISTAFDDYECWISAKQHTRISEKTFGHLQKSRPVYCGDLVHPMQNQLSENKFHITAGAVLPCYKDHKLSFESLLFGFEGAVVVDGVKRSAGHIAETAHQFLDAPYLWGGKTPFGIDCSAFVQLVYRLNGYKLPRDSHQQVECGAPLSFVEEAETGDLAFFDNEEGRIVHVGVLLNNEQIIHASGRVRIDKFDHYGIYNTAGKGYSHTLRVIKRVIS